MGAAESSFSLSVFSCCHNAHQPVLEQPNIVFLSLLKPNENTSTLVNLSMISVVWFLDVNSHPVVALNVPVWLVLANISSAASHRAICFVFILPKDTCLWHLCVWLLSLSLTLRLLVLVECWCMASSADRTLSHVAGVPRGWGDPSSSAVITGRVPSVSTALGKFQFFCGNVNCTPKSVTKRGKGGRGLAGVSVCVSCMYDRTLVQHVSVCTLYASSIHYVPLRMFTCTCEWTTTQ